MNIDKEQAAFEAWWGEKYTSHKLNRRQTLGGDVTRDYRDQRVQYALEAWLERARQFSQRAQSELAVIE